MKNLITNTHTAVISHKRPSNVQSITKIVGECTFYVNIGEAKYYLSAGAKAVVECGTNICQARNRAIKDAQELGLPSIQVSDDLKSIKHVHLYFGKHVVKSVEFQQVVEIMVKELLKKKFYFGGVAVTSNRLNYTGEDFSYDKLIVCDLICIMPGIKCFDENVALKEDYDYDLVIDQLLNVGGVVRCNQFLCDFPHRGNKGGANTYRNTQSEDEATKKLYAKWGNLIKPHATRPGQISLNYQAIANYDKFQTSLF